MKPLVCLSRFFILCPLFLTGCEKRTEESRFSTAAPAEAVTQNTQLLHATEHANTVSEHHAYLELIAHNSTSAAIDGVEVALGRNSCTFGIVGMGVSAGYLGWTHPVSTSAVVRWRDSGATKRESRVEILNVYNPNLPGRLTFTIDGTNATAKWEKINR